MAAQYKTQCPHCGAQFRISEQHLAQAKGAVRCGSCLKVFQATDHIIPETPAKPAARKAKPAAASQPSAPPASTPEQWSLPSQPEGASRWTLGDDLSDEMAEPGADFGDAAREPATKQSDTNNTTVSLGGLELSDSFMSLDGDEPEGLDSQNFSDMAGAGRRNQSADTDESWAEQLLEELEDSEKPAATPVRADALSLSEREEDAAKKAQKAAKKKPQPTTAAAPPPPSNNAPDWAQDSDDFFNEDTFDLLNDGSDTDDDIASIDLPAAAERAPSRITIPMEALAGHGSELIKWGALSLAALLIFTTQYLVFNFSELARNPSWRPFYANICGAIGCNLPNLSDVARLRGANLVVRNHPQAEGALVVDVIVFNDGKHPQPFPLLELGFTSLDGRAIASRRFQPAEYLQGDLKGMTSMPSGVPIRLSLEILDPGSAAVNYTLRFFPTPQSG
jgi:predicted Zn finger-like uncharacterized protein